MAGLFVCGSGQLFGFGFLPLKISDKRTTGYIKVKNWDKQYDIRFEQIENFSLVYALDPMNND